MRNLLDWIAARLGYVTRDYARVRNGADAIARGQRWEAFYREEGGIADMITRLRMGYFEASAALGVSDLDKRYEYALADRLARELDREVRTIIETGKMRQADADAKVCMAAVAR
ncbi:MAG: hypothetical protein ACOYBT_09970 [Polynucleobacter sp.]